MSQHRQYVEQLFEDRVGETLAVYTGRLRDEGESWRSIERRIHAASGGAVSATSVSLQRWYGDDERGAA